jgi:hypothetical protein
MFDKIKEFLFGKLPEQAPTVAPYKVEAATVEAAPVTASVPDTVMITPEAVAPTLVVDTISTAAVTAPAKPKKPRAPAKPKTPAVKKPAAAKKSSPAAITASTKTRGRKPKAQ